MINLIIPLSLTLSIYLPLQDSISLFFNPSKALHLVAYIFISNRGRLVILLNETKKTPLKTDPL